MGKGVFLVARQCCRVVRVKLWCKDVDEELARVELRAALTAQGVATVRIRQLADPTAQLLVTHFRSAHADTDVHAITAQLTAQGYEEF